MPSTPKITDVQRYTLHVPFRPAVADWTARYVWQWQVVEVTRVETDAGLVGWGETLPHYTWGRVTDAAVSRVRGRPAAEFLADDSLGAGLQMAVYDVLGKALEVPVYRLLGLPQVRDHCPIAWWNVDLPPGLLAEEARAAAAAGYTAHKTKARPWFDVYAQTEAVSAATPDNYRLGLDWNGTLLDAATAKPVLAELDRYPKIGVYETPIPHDDLAGYRELRAAARKPLVVHFAASPPFGAIVMDRTCDGFLVCDGGCEAIRKGVQAAGHNLPFWLQIVGLGLTTALCAHIGAVLTHARWPAVTGLNTWGEDLLTEPLTVSGGHLRVPEGPGLGVTFDETALQRHRIDPDTPLPEPRLLLTVTWPDGTAVDYTSYQQCYTDFIAGNRPAQERGATMTMWPDDGSPEWARRHAQAAEHPAPPVKANWQAAMTPYQPKWGE